jgi:integrase
MMARKLTAISVENARCKRVDGTPVRTEIPDRGCPGLYLIIQPSDERSWAVRYRIGGRSRKLTLDGGGTMTLAAARVAATQALHQVELGRDPASDKQAARTASAEQAAARLEDSVEKLADEFIERYGKRKLRPNTLAQYQSVLRRFVLPAWRGRTVHDVTRRQIIALIEPIAEQHPYMANRTLGVIHKFFAWLAARDVIAANPAAGVEMPGVEESRSRALNDAEIRALWLACDDDPIFGAATRIMLLTGARRSEVAEMTFKEIDERERLWVLPSERNKSKQEHKIPLSPLAWDIIKAVPRVSDTHVFSTTGEGPIANFHHIKAGLDAKLNFAEHWQFHDIRRSVASGLQRLGTRVEVIEATLGHRSGSFRGIIGTYQVHDYADERRITLQRWADHVVQLAGGEQQRSYASRVIEAACGRRHDSAQQRA